MLRQCVCCFAAYDDGTSVVHICIDLNQDYAAVAVYREYRNIGSAFTHSIQYKANTICILSF